MGRSIAGRILIRIPTFEYRLGWFVEGSKWRKTMKRISKLILGISLCLLVSTSAFASGWFSFGFNTGGRPHCAPRYYCGYSYCAPPVYYYPPPPVVTYRYYYSPPTYYYSAGGYYCR